MRRRRRNESDQLLFHLNQYAPGREDEAGEGNDQETSTGERADHGVYQPPESAGPLDDRERPADQEDVEDDEAGVDIPLGIAAGASMGSTGVAGTGA